MAAWPTEQTSNCAVRAQGVVCACSLSLSLLLSLSKMSLSQWHLNTVTHRHTHTNFPAFKQLKWQSQKVLHTFVRTSHCVSAAVFLSVFCSLFVSFCQMFSTCALRFHFCVSLSVCISSAPTVCLSVSLPELPLRRIIVPICIPYLSKLASSNSLIKQLVNIETTSKTTN